MLRCPVCSTSDAFPLVAVARMPLIGCLFAESESDAADAECGTLDIVVCPECGHIYNRAFDSERIKYVAGYDNALGFSPHHRAQSKAKAKHLIHTHGLRHKVIVDIGCGNGDFLSRLCAEGVNVGVGYDPSQESRAFRAGEGFVEVRSKRFETADHGPVDFVCSQHVLEHLEDLQRMLRSVRGILKHGGTGYFEVPNGRTIFRDRHIWDLTYEHVSYFTPQSLHRALSDAGFSILEIGSSFGGQYLDAEVLANDGAATRPPVSNDNLDVYKTFPDAFTSIMGQWNNRMTALLAEGRRVVLWGAGTKAVSFLNMLGIRVDKVKYVVDVNPRKSGRFVPGMAQMIVPPDHLRQYRPDVTIAMNAEYLHEIQATLESMSLHCDLLAVTGAPSEG